MFCCKKYNAVDYRHDRGFDIRLALKIPDNIQVAFKKNERILRGGYTFAHFSLLCVEFQ